MSMRDSGPTRAREFRVYGDGLLLRTDIRIQIEFQSKCHYV